MSERTPPAASPVIEAPSAPPVVIPGAGGPPHVHPGGRGVRPLGDAVVHPNLSAVQLQAVHRLPGRRRVLDALEINEGEAAAVTRVAVENHLALLDLAEATELFLQLSLGGVEAQPEDSQALNKSL